MNQSPPLDQDRSTVAARFFSRLHRYKNLLVSRWWVLALGVGLGIGALCLLAWKSPPGYVSTGRMILGTKLSLPTGNYNEDNANFFGTQISLMRSDTVSNRAVMAVLSAQTNLVATSVSLDVTVSPKTSIFKLEARGSSPEFVQAYLDAVMEEYGKLKREMRRRTADTTKNSISEELTRLAAELQRGKQALVDYQSSNSVVFLQDQGNSAGDYLAYLTKQQANLKSELQLLKMLTLDENVERQLSLSQQSLTDQQEGQVKTAAIKFTEEGGKSTPPSPATDDRASAEEKRSNASLVGSQSEYLKAKQQILLLKAQRQELGEFLRPKHPKMIALDEDIARKEKLLDIFRDQSQEQLKNLAHSLELQIQNLQAEIREWEGKSLEISRKMAEYQTIKEENQRLQSTFDRLMTANYSLDVDKGVAQDSLTVMEPASTPVLTSLLSSKRLILAGLLGLMLGMSVLLVIDRLDDRPTSVAELQDIIDEEVLGQIPLVRSRKGVRVPVLQADDDRHAMVEAYRNLRSSIMFIGSPEQGGAGPRTLVVTSAIPGDGKSMTSANLAITLARAGHRVLLVDADLRRGVMHKHFGCNSTPGLSQVLNGDMTWKQGLIATDVPGLDVLPRGEMVRHPGELFVLPSKKKLLQEVSAQYEYVIFDTAPVMAADDVSNLAPYVDGVVLVIRAGYTSGRVARAALDLLALRKVKVLGVVFNAVKSNTSEYYYYHYKDYYAKYPTT